MYIPTSFWLMTKSQLLKGTSGKRIQQKFNTLSRSNSKNNFQRHQLTYMGRILPTEMQVTIPLAQCSDLRKALSNWLRTCGRCTLERSRQTQWGRKHLALRFAHSLHHRRTRTDQVCSKIMHKMSNYQREKDWNSKWVSCHRHHCQLHPPSTIVKWIFLVHLHHTQTTINEKLWRIGLWYLCARQPQQHQSRPKIQASSQ